MTDLEKLKPTTLAGVKRLAQQLKKRDGIKHAEALKKAAQQAGFASYQDAQSKLGGMA